jgi:acyl carrier protein
MDRVLGGVAARQRPAVMALVFETAVSREERAFRLRVPDCGASGGECMDSCGGAGGLTGEARGKKGFSSEAKAQRIRLVVMEPAPNQNPPEVTLEILREILVENCMVKVDPAAIGEETPLFGPDSIGLDSLDALQMAVALEKRYGVVLSDSATARDAFQSLGVLRDWILRNLAPGSGAKG